VEHVAERLGMSSVDLRRRWMLRLGDTTATGQVLTESVGSELVLDAALKAAAHVGTSARRHVRRGRGLSLVFHGSGFTGSGEKKLQGTIGFEVSLTAPSASSRPPRRSGRARRPFFVSLPPMRWGLGWTRSFWRRRTHRSFPIPVRRLHRARR